MPYVFQLLAALLEAKESSTLSRNFQSLIGPILAPPLWEQRGNVPALVRLLQAMLPRASSVIVQNDQLQSVLGLFQKLASSKTNESFAFDLLETVVRTFPSNVLDHYWVPIVQIMLTRLSNSSTQNFQTRFVRFFHFFSARDKEGLGCDNFIAITDKVQNDVFRGLYTQIILQTTGTLARPQDRKMAVISLTKICGDSEAFISRYPKGWPHTCNTLLKQLEEPPVPPERNDVIEDHDVEDSSFGVGFTTLQTIKKPPADVWPEIVDLRKWVGQYLKEADRRHGGRVGKMVQETLGEDAKKVLGAYMQL